jgi:alkyl hydroperoxide reductase subunit F
MLDQALLDQLRTVFAELPRAITLCLRPSTHERQAELVTMAEQLASTSSAIDMKIEGEPVSGVELTLLREGAPTGVTFRGVPGGHEFTSLVLAILNAAGKGKLPDEHTRARIAALNPGAELRTYISLDCTNCPDVVQALNLMALLHPDLKHEMVDGALAQDEVQKLGIQGVPAVFLGDTLVHSGKASFADLLHTLEAKLGKKPVAAAATAEVRAYDVVVIGGGPAGASAAIYTARKGLKTALIAERMGGQLQDTLGIENMIGSKYTEGKRLAADLEGHLRAYEVDVLEHRRVASVTPGAKKQIQLEGGELLSAGTVVVATGARWRELEVPGERLYLGRGVAFCPHCDGPFYKGKRIAVVGGGNSGVEAAIDLAGMVAHVTLIEYGDALRADAVLVDKLKSMGNVDIITSARTKEILGDGAKVTSMRYEDRKTSADKELVLDGVFVQIGLLPNSGFLEGVVQRNERGEIVVDEKGRTSAAGIYAAGDVTTTPFKQIVIAMGEGAKVALTAFEDSVLRAHAA